MASFPKHSKQCHWFDGSEYGTLDDMTYNDYVYTSPTLPSYMGLPFIVGGIIGQYAGQDYKIILRIPDFRHESCDISQSRDNHIT